MSPAPGLQLEDTKPEKTRPVRRFLARYFDLALVWTLSAIVIRPGGLEWSQQMSWFWSMVSAVLCVPLETILLTTWGTTPGKWMLSIRIEPTEGGSITFWKALDRSFNVLLWGLGGQVPFVGFVCMVLSFQNLVSSGLTRWDRNRFRVIHGPIRPLRCVGGVLLLIVLLFLEAARRLSA